MNGFVYHDDYNKYDLGLGHPLIGDKPRRLLSHLREKNMLNEFTLITPPKVTENDLSRVHTLEYIKRVKTLSKTGGWLANDTPAPKGIYDYARLPTGGTVLAGIKLFEQYQCTINPLGGFHHASKQTSSGFCFFNDIAVVIEHLRETKGIKRFQIIDLDVHHGNGTQDIYFRDPTVLNISFHQDGRTLYPGTGSSEKIGAEEGTGYTINLPLPPHSSNQSYQYAFEQLIPPLTEQFDPEILIYQSGVDTHHTDPLADMKLTHNIYYDFGKNIMQLSKGGPNKLLVVLGGGYNSLSSTISYYNLICGLLQKSKNQIVSEEPLKDVKLEDVKKRVKKIRHILSDYWRF